MRWLVAVAVAPALPGCAALSGREPVRVNVVALEPLAGEGLEARMTLKLRVLNPNDVALAYDGIWVELDLNGATLASGVSSERGSVPRYGETVLAVPVSISAMAALRQLLGLAQGRSATASYEVRGRLGGGPRFSASGDIDFARSFGLR